MYKRSPSNDPEFKTLTIVADDFGYGLLRNEGILECLQASAVSCTSVLVNCKQTESGVKLLKRNGLSGNSGLHFNITEGAPICDPESITSLVNKNGKFLGKEAFWGSPNIEEGHVEMELCAQIRRFEQLFGFLPFRVDGHQHVHVHPKVVNIFAAVLRKLQILQTRVPLEHDLKCSHSSDRNSFHERIRSLALESKVIFNKRGIRYAQVFIGMNFMGSLMSVEGLICTLGEVFKVNQTCELMVHPGEKSCFVTDGFEGDNFCDEFSMSADRVHEMIVLLDERLREFYEKNNIKV